MSKTVKITSPSQLGDLLKTSRIIVANFYADWCGPSNQIAPIFEQLSQSLSRQNIVTFIKINTDSQKEIVTAYAITVLPTFIIFQDGKVLEKVQGTDLRKLQAIIAKKLSSELKNVSIRGREASSAVRWRGADLPRGYVDITNQVEVQRCELLNVNLDIGGVQVLFDIAKPSALLSSQASTKDWVESDKDEQLLLFIPFQAMVKLHTLHITSLPPTNGNKDKIPIRPRTIKLFINKPYNLGFDEADDLVATQVIELSENDWNKDGTASIPLRYVKFQDINSIILFIVDGDGDGEKVRLDRIRVIGEAGDKRDTGKEYPQPLELLELESTVDTTSTLQASAVDAASAVQASTSETDLTSQSSLREDGSTRDGERKSQSREILETASDMSELAGALSPADKEIIIRLMCSSIRKAIPDIGGTLGTAASHPHVQAELMTKLGEFIRAMKSKVFGNPDRDGLKVLNLMRSDISRRCRDELLQPVQDTRWPTDLGDLEPTDRIAKVAEYVSQALKPKKWTEYRASDDDSPSSTSENGDGSGENENGESGDEFISSINAREVIDRLTADPAFEVLVSEIRDVVEQYAIDKLAVIQMRISESFASKPSHGTPKSQFFRARFNFDWDLQSYLLANYENGDSQQLSSIVATIGVLPKAQLCTVGDYFKQVQAWKSHKMELLETLQEALREQKVNGHVPKNAAVQTAITELPTAESISVDLISKTVFVNGSEEFIVVIAQQLAFLSALTHDNCDLEATKYAYVWVKERPEGSATPSPSFGPLFDVSVNLESPPREDEDGSCWAAILGHSVLITGYPTKDRPHRARGLEARPQTMAALVGIPVAVTFGGGYVFKGPYHALIPIEEFDGSVQWHVITSPSNEKELGWQDISKHCLTRLRNSEHENIDALWEARSFFGWCQTVVCYLGSCKTTSWAMQNN